MKSQGADQIETLQRETAKLKKINAALMSRVERSIDQQFNAFSLFETAIALDHQVLNRTRQLQDALRAIERSNDYLYRAKQQAEAASSLKSSVLISVTHDLLQPLNAARLTLSTFAEMEVSDRGTALLEQVDRSLLTLEDLLKTLLDISKLDAGVLKPEARPIPISSLFDPLRGETYAAGGKTRPVAENQAFLAGGGFGSADAAPDIAESAHQCAPIHPARRGADGMQAEGRRSLDPGS
jgi:signal transduction histidine kinase